ncbi:MAG: TAT-variant-translocated molybdopterin oxidoreductase [Verrucomicrobiales bacterium]
MSKRVWDHPAEKPSNRKYFRSLGELDDTPEFRDWIAREFPQGAAMMADEADAGQSRRDFMKLMGAATTMAGFGLAACRRPEARILPYSKNVEWVIPGKALFYASAMPRAGGCTPVVVTTYEGRPTHIQGNSLHPESNGSVDGFAQASVLDLYDPDRARDFKHQGKRSTRDEFLGFLDAHKASLTAEGGKGLALLVDAVVSPTRDRLLAKVTAMFPQAKVYRYEALDFDGARTATAKVFGPGVVQVPHFSVCDKIVSLDCDFLDLHRPKASSVSRFMSGRRAMKPGDPMNRLYVFESQYTLTGGMADHRLRVHASQIMKTAVALAKALAKATGDTALEAAAARVSLVGDFQPREDADTFITETAKDLAASKGGRAMVLAGPQQPAEVHALVAAINTALGAFAPAPGKPVPPIELKQTQSLPAGTLGELAEAVASKVVTTLAIVSTADPCYDAPASLNWAALQKSIPTVIHVGFRDRTATARAATWSVPGTHYLEQWGDVRALSGVYSIVQPMILPLFGGVSDLEFLTLLASDTPVAVKVEPPPPAAPINGLPPEESKDPGYLAVRETFAGLAQGDMETAWSTALRDGLLAGTSWPAFTGAPQGSAVTALLAGYKDIAPPSQEAFELTLVPDGKLWDGRYINNAWLQEMPDSISKVTWDNAALVSVRTASALGLDKYLRDKAQTITIEVAGRSLVVPVVMAPGHADNAITLALGYGQEGKGAAGPGRVGEGTGVNAYPLRDSSSTYWLAGAKVTVTGDTVPLATTQEHHTMYGRELIREGTADRFKDDPSFATTEGMDSHIPPDFTFYKNQGRQGQFGNTGGLFATTPHLWDTQHQWGMVIDLNACIGCNSCSLACQSENNIPTVGKRQVIIGRDMNWIRMDRYFAVDVEGGKLPPRKEWESTTTAGPVAGGADENAGHGHAPPVRELDDPEMLVQPVACQHCEAAPCETVCPVNATIHSEDGLNLMVYNRCIGTRYCANNCPWKARRFNYFDYNKRADIKREDSILGLHSNNYYLGPFGELKDDASLRLQRNPNVTVRMRGVIEKCTYCIQRIQAAKIDQKTMARRKATATGIADENLTLTDEELRTPTDKVITACQAACPADAIVFGNLRDNASSVSKLRGNTDIVGEEHGVPAHPRAYSTLRYIGARPRTSYLARIKNPNPALLAASPIEKRKVGQASAHM